MENQTELKWHQKPTPTIIFLIFFFPVGLYLMWKNELWGKTTRIVISIIFGLLIINGSRKNNDSSNVPEPCDCVTLLLAKPNKSTFSYEITDQIYPKWEKCYDTYSGPAGAILECDKKETN